MEDNCMKSPSQQFLGNPKKEITTVYNNILYELDDINKLSLNKRYEKEFNGVKDTANDSNIYDIDLKISDEMKDDLNNMKDSDFIKKWRERYFYQMETPVTYDEDGNISFTI